MHDSVSQKTGAINRSFVCEEHGGSLVAISELSGEAGKIGKLVWRGTDMLARLM